MSIIKVKTGGITADAITDALIADDVVGTEHLTANEVDTTALGADAVTGAQLADNAVNSEHYTDGSVDTAHIADANVTQGKIADQAINEAKMQISNAPTNGYALTAQSGNTGGLTWAEIGGGKINQVVQTSNTVNTTSSSQVEMFSLAITPSASNSKVLAIVGVTAQLDANEYTSFDLYRGSLSSGTKVYDGGEALFNGASITRLGFSFSYLDSPSSTSAVTYTVVGSPTNSSTVQFGATGVQTMTLMEVLA